MPGFDNNVMFADNVDFTGSSSVVGQVTADGQLLIGATAAPHIRVATLTGGTGVSIDNSSGSITVNSVGGGVTWVLVITPSESLAANTGYITSNLATVVATLPAVSKVGDMIRIIGLSNTDLWKVAQNAGNQIFFGNSPTTPGATGYIASNSPHDTVELLCITANANWAVLSAMGNITIF